MSESYHDLLARRRLERFAERGRQAQEAIDAMGFGPPIPPARARTSDPETSHEAAARVDQAAQHAAILEMLATHGPLTADRLDEVLGWRSATASRRLPELVVMGKVERLEDTAPTRTGRRARLHRLAGAR